MRIRVDAAPNGDRMMARCAMAAALLIGVLATVSALTNSASAAKGVQPPVFRTEGALAGVIQSTRPTRIHAESAARVAAVLARPGDMAPPGQLLMELENDELSTAAEAARSRFSRAQRVMADLERRALSGIRSQVQKQRYELALQEWNAAQRQLADFNLAEYESALRAAKAWRQRLASQPDADPLEIERASQLVSQESRALDMARLRGAQLRQNAELADGKLKIEKAVLELEESAELSAARVAFQDARAELRIATQRLAQLRVTAPRAGSILAVEVLPDDRVYPGALLVRMADLTSLEVEASAPARLVRYIQPGDPVTVRLPLDPPMDLSSTVDSVSPAPDPVSRAYAVRIRIGNPNPSLILAGLECAVSFPKIYAAQAPWWRRIFGL